MVEQYSQVLDELEHARLVCPNVDPPDLPRVIVVGDQSSGKTSVLEAVARLVGVYNFVSRKQGPFGC